MRYFEFYAETAYCGTDETELCVYSDEVTEEQLNDDCEMWGRNHCEGYEYLATGWDEDEEMENLAADFWSECGWGWRELTEEEYITKKLENNLGLTNP